MIFVETRPFRQRLADFMDDSAFRVFQNELQATPEKGEVMPGCGGFRKVRVGDEKRGKGKRGGARVVYLNIPEADRIDLVAIYGKNEKEDLTANEKKMLASLAQEMRTEAVARAAREAGRKHEQQE